MEKSLNLLYDEEKIRKKRRIDEEGTEKIVENDEEGFEKVIEESMKRETASRWFQREEFADITDFQEEIPEEKKKKKRKDRKKMKRKKKKIN